MGLDIYLRHSKNWSAALANQKEFEEISERENLWGNGTNESTRDKRLDELAAALNCDKWGSSKDIVDAEVPASKINLDHICKVGYLRSSYNPSGFNHVSPDRGGMSFYEIFGVKDHDEYHQEIDWRGSLARAAECVRILEERERGPMAGFYPICIAANVFKRPTCSDEAEALSIFAKQLAEQAKRDSSPIFGDSYSNSEGDFFMSGIKVYAAIPGAPAFLREAPVYLIAKREADGEPDHYVQAAQIAREMIKFVLAQPDAQNYRLSWSA